MYAVDQVKNVFNWVPANVKWFLVGGPADSNEAQVFKTYYPGVKALGCEPNRVGYEYQSGKFPGTLLNVALWDTDHQILEELTPSIEGSYLDVGRGSSVRQSETGSVLGRTLDSLSVEFGPFIDAVLWLDIEGSERRALLGASELLSSGAIKLINAETYCHGDSESSRASSPLDDILVPFGFKEVHRWNANRHPNGCRYDVIWKQD